MKNNIIYRWIFHLAIANGLLMGWVLFVYLSWVVFVYRPWFIKEQSADICSNMNSGVGCIQGGPANHPNSKEIMGMRIENLIKMLEDYRADVLKNDQ